MAEAPASVAAPAHDGAPRASGPDTSTAPPSGSELGYILFDLASGAALEESNADHSFIPASTTKLATTIAALRLLGPAAIFETTLLAGHSRNGPNGAVALVGGGDPTLSTEDLAELAGGLRAALASSGAAPGTAPVATPGRFVYDESAFVPFEAIDPGQPLAAPYNVGGGALVVNYDRVSLDWHHTAGRLELAEPVTVSSSGQLLAATVSAEPAARDLGPGIPYLPYAARDGGELWQVSPSIASRGQAWLPVRHPGPLAASLFRTLALADGVALPPAERGPVPPGLRPIARHSSQPLAEIVAGTLKYSNNLSAEMIGLATARKLAGRPLPLPTATQTLAGWWRATQPRTNWSGWQMASFSGLNSAGRATPRQLAAFLMEAARPGADGVDLLGILPVRDELHLPGIWAKTGTLDYASSLAGIILAPRHGRLGFVIMITDFPDRAALDRDRDVRRLVRGENRAWTEAAHRLEKSVLQRWLATE